MSATTTLPLVARFALIIAGLQHVIAAAIARHPTKAALIVLAHTRLARLMARFTSLIARAEAGTLRPPGPPRRATPRTHQPEKIPRGFGWLSIFGSWQVGAYRSQLEHLLADPEMERLLQTTPQAGRILRPLCRMLGVRAPPGAVPPPPSDQPPPRVSHVKPPPQALGPVTTDPEPSPHESREPAGRRSRTPVSLRCQTEKSRGDYSAR